MSPPDTPNEAWVGCYTAPDGEAGLVSLTETTAALRVNRSGRLVSPSWLTPLEPAAGAWLAVSEATDSALSVLDLSGTEPEVTSTVPTGGADACHVALSPDGRWIGVAHYTSGSVALLAAPGAAGLQPPVDLVSFVGFSSRVPDRQEAPHAHQVVWLDDATVLVPDLGADLIRVLRLETLSDDANPPTARLIEDTPIEVPPGTGPRHLVLRPPSTTRPDQDPWPDCAVVGELSGQVLSYQRDRGGWTLTHMTPTSLTVGAQPSGFRGFPDQDTLVVANRGVNTLALVSWNAEGQLELVDEFACGGDHPRDVVVHQSALWVANQHSDSVAVFAPIGGGWEPAASVAVTSPACIVFPTSGSAS